MSNRIWGLVFITMLAAFAVRANNNLWKQADINGLPGPLQNIHATQYLVFTTDEQALKSELSFFNNTYSNGLLLTLPMGDGAMRHFRVRNSPILLPELAARYPELSTYTAVAVDDERVTAKLDFTIYGFHAMVFDGASTSFIDPAYAQPSGYYIVHYKKNEVAAETESKSCTTIPADPAIKEPIINTTKKSGYRTGNGQQLRTYRLALSCSHQYAVAATGYPTPTILEVLSKMTTTMNRVNGVYEREVSVTMVFVANEDTLIWNTDATGPNGPDPFSGINGNAGACLSQNQATCDERIGNANYDLGHVFTTGAGGYSEIGIICTTMRKARSATGQPHPTGDGFDIDFLAHEMGHEFGADHTFTNDHDGFCSGNDNRATAYEPGSGSTIMAYAGICHPDNIQAHSDDYFHAISLWQIQSYITTGGDVCAVKTLTNNKPVYLPSFNTSYTIPFLTPFELIAPVAIDSVASSAITYCWEEYDLSAVGHSLVNTHEDGPIFRSYPPVSSPVRVFPNDSLVLAGLLSNAGIDNAEGEKAPDVARTLAFRLTMRNIYNGHGCFLIPDDSIHLDVINTGTGFKVTSQVDSTAVYVGSGSQTITWDVVGTDRSPVNAEKVDIYMSEDGGLTWPHQIGTFPNTGTATVPLPNPDTTTKLVRIKVKGTGNVFFNVNKYNFTVTHSDGADTSIRLYPVPVHTTLRISSGNQGPLDFKVFNEIGQLVYADVVNGIYDIPVHLWAKGVYIMRLVDARKKRTIKKFIVD